ncbi:MAG: hypothetical protein R3B48_18855 [Kofleriaceae bacterium]
MEPGPRAVRSTVGAWARCLALAGCVVAAAPAHGRAEPYPAGSVGAVLGAQAGTAGSYTSLGAGVAYGLTAAWQPMADEQRVGWGARWSVLFGYFPASSSAAVSDVLLLVEMDLVARLRVAPTLKPGRYLTLGVGASLLRSNEPISPDGGRAFAGPIATVGYEHNAFGAVLLGFDLRYGLIETGPASIGLLVSVGTAL